MATLEVVTLNNTELPSFTDDTLGVIVYVGPLDVSAIVTVELVATNNVLAASEYSLILNASLPSVAISLTIVLVIDPVLLLIVTLPVKAESLKSAAAIPPLTVSVFQYNIVPVTISVVVTLNVDVLPSLTELDVGTT